MGIMHDFCQALVQELKAYETKKTARKKKLHPTRQQDVTAIKQILEDAEKQDPPNIRLLHENIMGYIGEMKMARFAGFILLSSDLRTQLCHVLSQSKFNVEKMVITELQEQQTNQHHISRELNNRLTQHEQEIALLQNHLDERDELCEALRNQCNQLIIENTQLKEALNAYANENITDCLNQLQTQVTTQQTTISQLTTELQQEKQEKQLLSEEVQRLRAENEVLKKAKEATPPPQDKPTGTPHYASPLKNKLPRFYKAPTSTPINGETNTVEFKT